MKRITIEEGPLAGNEYDVPDDTTRLDIPVDGGHYTVGPKHAVWHPDEERRPKTRPTKAEREGGQPAPTADTPE